MTKKTHVWYSHDYKIRFLSIPKNGSTFIKHALDLDHKVRSYEVQYVEKYPVGYKHILKYPLFLVLREPTERWRSTYRMLKRTMNFPDYKTYLDIFDMMGKDLNNHLDTQWEWITSLPKEPDFVIRMEDLDRIFPGVDRKNVSNPVKEKIIMPDKAKEIYKKDFQLWGMFRKTKAWKQLDDYIKFNR